MATAEQNTLLMNQLFRQPAEDYVDRSNQKLKYLMTIAQAQREEQLKRDLADLQAQREDARYKSLSDREDARVTGMETRQAATITAAEKRQKAALEERDALELQRAFQKLYPEYARAAAEAGQEITPITDYEKTPEGLGQLTADLGSVKVGYQQKLMKTAADASLAEHEDVSNTVAETKKRLEALSKASPQDEKMARSAAVKAVQTAIETDPAQFGNPSKDKVKRGISALANGETEIAKTLLGEPGIRAFEDSYEKTLFSLPNTKARLQAVDLAQKDFLQARQQAVHLDSELRKVGGTNPFLAEGLAKRRTSMRDLMKEPEAQKRRTIDEIFGAAPAGATTTTSATETPSAKVKTYGDVYNESQYRFPGGVLGTAERAVTAVPQFLSNRGQELDLSARLGLGGLGYLATGNFGPPPSPIRPRPPVISMPDFSSTGPTPVIQLPPGYERPPVIQIPPESQTPIIRLPPGY